MQTIINATVHHSEHTVRRAIPAGSPKLTTIIFMSLWLSLARNRHLVKN